jgi:hypothetical protein
MRESITYKGSPTSPFCPCFKFTATLWPLTWETMEIDFYAAQLPMASM